MITRKSGLIVPEEFCEPTEKQHVVSTYRWNKLSKMEQDYALAEGWLPPIAGGAAKTYMVTVGAMPTTAAVTKLSTGTAIKTLIQLADASTRGVRVIEWGISFDATLSTPAQVELIDTTAIAATVTAFVANDINKMNGPNDEASAIQVGTALSGYNASAEGTTTAGRLGDYQLVAQAYVKQFPLGREFEIPVSHLGRIRVTSGVSVGAVAYIVWEE